MNAYSDSSAAGSFRRLGAAVIGVLLAAALAGCTGTDPESATDQRITQLEDRLAALQEDQTRTAERLDEQAQRIQQLEEVASRAAAVLPAVEQWSKAKDDGSSTLEETALERTIALVKDSVAEVHYVDHPGRQDRSLLLMPMEFVEGETPLIVSLHGYGGDSALHAAYFPLHQRVNAQGFALLLPNGTMDGEGNRFWNPTDQCCDGGKTGEDDVAYLAELVSEAGKLGDFGHIYFFGYSNGGFMSYHVACKGLPGLRAVASLAGTSYVYESSCQGAPPVSILHVHGTEDEVVLFDGDQLEPALKVDDAPAFYAGAHDMVARWSRRADCDWSDHPQPSAAVDLDKFVPGPETEVFRLASGCAEGIDIQLWMGVGTSHSPGYDHDFVDALLDWLLSQN